MRRIIRSALPVVMICVVTINDHWNKENEPGVIIDRSNQATVDFDYRLPEEIPVQISLENCGKDVTVRFEPNLHPEFKKQ